MRATVKIGIIGAGKIGGALVAGLLKTDVVKPTDLYVSDVDRQRCRKVAETYNVTCSPSNEELVKQSNVVVIAVKPKDVKKVLNNLQNHLNRQHILISVAAGITSTYIAELLKTETPIVRVIPNLPCSVRAGITAISAGPHTSRRELQTARRIFSCMGAVVTVEERRLDAVTALSGSGPAYVCLVIEAMAEAGGKVGLPRSLALKLATWTLFGSAKMLLDAKMLPTQVRDLVATPGGTTAEGLAALEECKVRSAFTKAITRAERRAKELSQAEGYS